LHIYHDFRENRVILTKQRLIGIEYEHFLALVDLAEQKHLEKQVKEKQSSSDRHWWCRPDMSSSKQGICLCRYI